MADKTPDPLIAAEAVRAHAGFLLRAARGMGLSAVDAEELVSDVFAAFLEALPRFEGRSSVRTFLYGILYRKACERGRRAAREQAVDPADELFETRFGFAGHWSRPSQGPAEEADARETASLIEFCLKQLTFAQRAAFVLKEVEGESSESARNILGVEDTHLRVLLFRARNRLRECLEEKWKKGSSTP